MKCDRGLLESVSAVQSVTVMKKWGVTELHHRCFYWLVKAIWYNWPYNTFKKAQSP